jgi:hypothetical protein
MHSARGLIRRYLTHNMLCLLLSMLPCATMRAQQATMHAQQAPVCDTLRLHDVHGVRDDTLRLILRRASGGQRLDARAALDALDALRRHFVLPARLALPFRIRLNDSLSTLGVAMSVDFMALRDGAAKGIRLSQSSYVPALDSAVLSALAGASAERAFAPFESSIAGDQLPLVLEIAFGLEDSVRVGIDAALVLRPQHAALTMPTVIEPQRLPRFTNARAAGSTLGFVDVSFAVNEAGRVLPGTVEFTRVTTRTLAMAMLEVLPAWRFLPATIAGCPVPALVSQSFSFVYPP